MAEETKETEVKEEPLPDEKATRTEKTAENAGKVTGEKSEKKDKKEKKSEIENLRDELAAKDAEIAESKDKYLRLYAEYDNFRKRSAKEKDGIYTDAVSDTVKEFLSVIDNIERASQYNGDAEKVAEGLAMTAKSAQTMLGKLGITCFAAAGDKFDPSLHNAVMHTEDDEYGEGEIVEVFQKGYRKGDKVIRYAMVKVAN